MSIDRRFPIEPVTALAKGPAEFLPIANPGSNRYQYVERILAEADERLKYQLRGNRIRENLVEFIDQVCEKKGINPSEFLRLPFPRQLQGKRKSKSS
jgi:hypothetical protein